MPLAISSTSTGDTPRLPFPRLARWRYTFPMETLPDHQQRVSTPEREQAISRLQDAYIRGQLSEHELGERIDRALSAVVKVDLSGLVGDLPALAPAASVSVVRSPWWRRQKKGESIYKATVRKNGAWTVPEMYKSSIYKGMLVLDLRHAVLTSPDTLIELNAYKSRVAILVPPEFRVEVEGNPYKGSLENLTNGGVPGGPRVLVRGSMYKSSVVVTGGQYEE